LAIGICAQADAGVAPAALRARAADWIRAAGVASGAPLVSYSWPIPSMSARDFDSAPLAGGRWALVRDAAGLVEPISGGGISFAPASAGWLADALSRDGNTAADYMEQAHDEGFSELRRAAQLEAGFFRPPFLRLLVHALRQSAAVRAVMADLVAGRQTYARLRWRLVKTL